MEFHLFAFAEFLFHVETSARCFDGIMEVIFCACRFAVMYDLFVVLNS